MAIFASYFWLWSIVGLLGFLMLYTFGSLMNFAGFLSPVKAVGQRLDRAAPRTRLVVLAVVIVLLGYPSAVHKLWADATANEIRREFQTIPTVPGAVSSELSEQWGGLYDPTGTDGAYVVGWFGSSLNPNDVQAHYRRAAQQKGWVEQPGDTRALRFLDNSNAAQSRYELVVAVAPSGSLEAPAMVAGQPTVFAVRLGAVDPRVTTQVAWLVDCLVRAAPTFPSCEAMGWHPLERAGTLPSSRGIFGR
jgi:hypothetical protein